MYLNLYVQLKMGPLTLASPKLLEWMVVHQPPEDILFLEGEVNFMQNTPLNGDECVALGWTYLGHTSTNKANIEAAVATAVSKGYSFKSLFYMKGYFVYGCEALKLFYDQQ